MSLLFPHRLNLPAALSGRRCDIRSNVGRLSYYAAAPDAGAPPLLLIHSVNAAGSAYEVRPLYEHYRLTRSVYAFDLPGFGFSERGDRSYTPRLMTDAVSAMVAEIQSIHGTSPIDALALSLGAEFLARCAAEEPQSFRSLALISPTGFSRTTPDHAPAGETRAMPKLRKVLTFVGRLAFDLLTTKPSIRYFLNKTWGSKDIDEGLLEYDYRTTHQPGAQYAPYAFVSGYLFSRNIQATYRALTVPVWMAHGVRGDFTDYSKAPDFALKSNWMVRSFPTGALPHFESLDAVVQSYDSFLDQLPQRGAT